MRLLRRMQDERGVALVLVLLVMAALAAGVTTVVVETSSSNSTAVRASADQVAYNAAEAGVNMAMAVLHASNTNAYNASALPTTTTAYPVGCSGTACTGSITWGGTLNGSNSTWTITSTGSARNTAAPNLPNRTRTLTATSYVQPDLSQTVNNQVWNYIYAFGKKGSGLCDVQVDNNVTVSAPVYAEGNLCLANNASIQGKTSNPPTPVSVVVKGVTTFAPGSGVGTTTQVVEAHMYQCGSGFSSTHTCNPISKGGADKIYAGTFDNTPTQVKPVSVDWSNYYTNSQPGPLHPCQATTAVNPPTFDSDSIQNLATNGNAPSNSGSTSANTLWLTPDSYDYTCRAYDSGGNIVGELSWNHTTRHLTVAGTIYYDGNVYFSGTSYYTGQATLYATGWMNLYGRMCGGVITNGDCVYNPGSPGGWNPNTNMLIVVAHGNNGSGDSIAFTNSNGGHWQGGMYSQLNLTFANNAQVEGPIIAGYLHFSNNVSAVPFPVITEVPTGAPGNPNVYADALPPVVSG